MYGLLALTFRWVYEDYGNPLFILLLSTTAFKDAVLVCIHLLSKFEKSRLLQLTE